MREEHGVNLYVRGLALCGVAFLGLFFDVGRVYATSLIAVDVMFVVGDVDGDGIEDGVERLVCGSVTCATGVEDRDGDGVSDAVEVAACGDRVCVDPARDSDGDGIPDFAELLVCGSVGCANSLEDADGDGIGDWVEFVVCGGRFCATGVEDYDGDGVSDVAQLAACVRRVDLAVTGQAWFWPVCVLTAVFLGAAGVWLLRFMRQQRVVDQLAGVVVSKTCVAAGAPVVSGIDAGVGAEANSVTVEASGAAAAVVEIAADIPAGGKTSGDVAGDEVGDVAGGGVGV